MERVNQPPALTQLSMKLLLTLQEGASGMDIKKRGGAFNARPYKNPFKGPFGTIFLHRKGWGIKITSEKFFEIGF